MNVIGDKVEKRLPEIKIGVFGLGYVGLTVAVCFASRGFKVLCSDIIKEKVESVNRGLAGFYEPSMDELLEKVVSEKMLKTATNLKAITAQTDFSFICVGTPSKSDGSINLRQVADACKYAGQGMRKRHGYHVVVIKSTVTPGTTQNLVKSILEKFSHKRVKGDFGLTVNPEFLREGSAINDMFNPDRIIIGEYDERSGNALETLYKAFHGEFCPPILRMNLASAEMVKYASNAFLATKISFINEIANICERISDVDVVNVAEGMGLDPRIGRSFLNAGVGFGGSCFPKDVKALISFARSLNYEPKIIREILSINYQQALRGVELIKELLGEPKGKVIAVLGLSFKPNTSDTREAPSLKIINELIREGIKIKVYDPAALGEARKILGNKVVYADSAIEAIKNADCCIIVTEWDEFRKLTPKDFISNMRNPAVVDGRRIFNPKIFSKKLKFRAIGLGS